MRVEKKETCVDFSALKPGDVFEYGGTFYTCCEPRDGYNAVSNAGVIVAFDKAHKVKYHPHAVLHI